MKTNQKTVSTARTHEGGRAARQSAQTELERTVATCLLWEPTFYESGSQIADRIVSLCQDVGIANAEIADLAVKARTDWKLRHVPLFLALQLTHRARNTGDAHLIRETLAAVIQRPDEMTEFLSLYWKNGRIPLAAQVKRGLAMAFTKFSAYQLAKWNRDKDVKLRDVLFLTHAKPKDMKQASLWKKLVDKTLEAADTWEVALSAGKDKKATFERLLKKGQLGYMALLQNLRNMEQANVNRKLVREALQAGAEGSRALPFRFIAAAKAAPSYAADLSDAMVAAIPAGLKLDGGTTVVVDVSGSMDDLLSTKSTLSRLEAASALAILISTVSQVRVFTFSNAVMEVPNHRGLPLADVITRSQPHGGTYLAAALRAIQGLGIDATRLVVITDEQSHDGTIHPWAKHSYIINVAPYQPGLVTHGGWHRINGWSERIVDWMIAQEGDVR